MSAPLNQWRKSMAQTSGCQGCAPLTNAYREINGARATCSIDVNGANQWRNAMPTRAPRGSIEAASGGPQSRSPTGRPCALMAHRDMRVVVNDP